MTAVFEALIFTPPSIQEVLQPGFKRDIGLQILVIWTSVFFFDVYNCYLKVKKGLNRLRYPDYMGVSYKSYWSMTYLYSLKSGPMTTL